VVAKPQGLVAGAMLVKEPECNKPVRLIIIRCQRCCYLRTNDPLLQNRFIYERNNPHRGNGNVALFVRWGIRRLVRSRLHEHWDHEFELSFRHTATFPYFWFTYIIFYKIQRIFKTTRQNRVIAQKVRRCFLRAETRVQFRVILCEISNEQNGTGEG
jgi:hypothetical protein